MSTPPVLSIRNLRVEFATKRGVVRAVRGVDLDLEPGHSMGLVGESGSGKSVTALAVVRLLPCPPARISADRIALNGEDLMAASPKRMREVRGAEIGMVFQDPMTSLNPSMTVGQQVAEVLVQHRIATKREAWQLAVEALARVRIPNADRVARQYPHTLSGGLRQRAMIAMAIAPQPVLLIADEPTTALDVTVQAEILDLLRELRAEYALTVLLITHDLGVVSEFCDDVAVMYAGRIVERAPAEKLFSSPKHPYTLGLLASLPDLDSRQGWRQRLNAIPGQPPSAAEIPPGCPFHPRCPRAMPVCSAEEPSEVELDAEHWVRCVLYEDGSFSG